MLGKKGKVSKPVDLDDAIPDDEPPTKVSDVEKKLKDTKLTETAAPAGGKEKASSKKKEAEKTPKQEEVKPKATEKKEDAKKPPSPEKKKEEAAPPSSTEKKKEEAAPSSEKKKEEAASSHPEEKKGKEDVPKEAKATVVPAPPAKKASSASVAPQEIPGKEVGTPKGSKGKAVSVWFGTNRKLDQTGLTFTNVREPETNTYGRADVEVAVAQRLEPETTSPLPLHRKKKHEDPPIMKQKEDAFFKDIQDRVVSVRDMDVTPQVVVMLHNYNVGFFDCAISTAQIAEDLNIQGAVLSYSWPSIGKSGNYETDSATLERSEPEIMDFLLKVVEKSGVDNVHVIADGKGCHGLLRVLQRISADQLEFKLGQVFLIAPDIDRELFENLAWLFPKYAERTTMYVSDHDRDVLRSVKRHKAPRAGAFEPYTVVPGVDTIAVSQLETDDFQSARVRPYEVVFVIHDMYDLMKNNDPPSRRLGLIKATSEGMTFWKFRK